MQPTSTVRLLLVAVALSLGLVPAVAPAFVDVGQTGDLATAARWSPTDIGGRGLGDGRIEVFVESGFAEAIATAVTGSAMAQDVADIDAAVLAAFHSWQSPVLQFDVTFDGPAVRDDPDSGGEIDLFTILSSDPEFGTVALFGITHMNWTFLANRQLTNGTVLAGNAITGADIYFATDRLAAAAPSFTREQQLRLFQRLVTHEIGHAIGLAHPNETPEINYDTDTDPSDAMLIDPTAPLADLILSPNVDGQAVMERLPTDGNALFNASLRNDDRGGRDALYPALGTTPAICQPMPQAGCRPALKSLLQIRDEADDARDKLLWKWVKGAATALGDFGAPNGATRYSLCLYKGALPALVAELALPQGTRWTAKSAKGFAYADATASPQGARAALLKSGAQDQAKIIVKAGGANLPDGLLPLGGAVPVVAQLVRADLATCWDASFDSAAVITDTAGQFKAKAQ